jgi:hypothetical protein
MVALCFPGEENVDSFQKYSPFLALQNACSGRFLLLFIAS